MLGSDLGWVRCLRRPIWASRVLCLGMRPKPPCIAGLRISQTASKAVSQNEADKGPAEQPRMPEAEK